MSSSKKLEGMQRGVSQKVLCPGKIGGGWKIVQPAERAPHCQTPVYKTRVGNFLEGVRAHNFDFVDHVVSVSASLNGILM